MLKDVVFDLTINA